MKKSKLFTFAILLLSGTTSLPAFSQVVSNDNEDEVYKVDSKRAQHDFVPGQVLVKFKDESPITVQKTHGKFAKASLSSVNNVLQQYGVDEMDKLFPREKAGRPLHKAKAYNGEYVVEKNLSQVYQVKMRNLRPDSVSMLVNALKALPEVEYAEPNYKAYIMGSPAPKAVTINPTQNPLYSQQWGLTYEGIPELWQKPIVNEKRPVIAILDTGVDITHPDLADNIWTNTSEAEGEEGYDNDNNGFQSDVHGWDFINNTASIRDFNSHGTHVAGIAAATDNGVGVIGANPLAYIMPVTVMQSDGTGDVATIARGIDYAAQNGADVINMSLGTYVNSRVMREALEKAYQTAVLVAAAGNDQLYIYRECGLVTFGTCFPAAYSFVLGVMANTEDGGTASFTNIDCDGPNYSAVKTMLDPDGFNYELTAPGTNILSTTPNGGYKLFNGTSMAAPLIAGAISFLQMVKEYETYEILWGDLIHSATILGAYNITKRPAELDMLNFQMSNRKDITQETEEDYSNDYEIDAGETVSIYPVIRTTFGEANNIKLKLEMGDEYENTSTIDILTEWVDFGFHLDAYGRNVSLNPIMFKVADDVADGRHIKLKIVATCDNTSEVFEWPFTIIITNLVKINGLIAEDKTLTADHVYLVNGYLGILEGATLTIEPGTHIEFMEGMGMASLGKLVAKGTPEKPILFTSHTGEGPWKYISSHDTNDFSPRDTISYCIIKDMDANDPSNNPYPYMKDCIIYPEGCSYVLKYIEGVRNTITDIYDYCSLRGNPFNLIFCNIVNNYFYKTLQTQFPKYSQLNFCNYFNNYAPYHDSNKYDGKYYSLGMYDYGTPVVDKSETPSYLGTSREDIIRPYIYEIGNAPTYGSIDLSNMPTRPFAEAHGIVWKVVVNGYDAQDEFEQLPPLGVGRHKFEVYFNRPMNKEVAPKISFGVRDPYTQNGVTEDGSWNEEGTIYTAYKTITGKTKSDGLNRIYVYGAEDNEFFEIPYEKTRFNINIQAAGSMATGFAAEAGLGKVDLTWNNENNNFEDAMGFNVYRYTQTEQLMSVYDENGNEVWYEDENGNWVQKKEIGIVADTVRINQEIIDTDATSYTDYDVKPGETYYYYYKVLSTDLKEYDISNVVSVTPLTSTKGDANGSGDVDVADVITTVNYAAGQQPKPFIYEAADMNEDLSIDILDVIGIIKTIMNPGAEAKASVAAVATYTIEDGVVYVDSPVEVAGVQVQLSQPTPDPSLKGREIVVAEDMKGFEHTSAWLSDNDYLFLGYNMNGKTLSAGKHAILIIGDAQIADIRLSDRYGRNIIAQSSTIDKIDRMARDVTTVSGIYDLQGRKLSGKAADLQKLPKGVYIVNGEKVVR